MKKIISHFSIDFQINILSYVSRKFNQIIHCSIITEPIPPVYNTLPFAFVSRKLNWPYYIHVYNHDILIYDLSSNNNNNNNSKFHLFALNLKENTYIVSIDIKSKFIWTLCMYPPESVAICKYSYFIRIILF